MRRLFNYSHVLQCRDKIEGKCVQQTEWWCPKKETTVKEMNKCTNTIYALRGMLDLSFLFSVNRVSSKELSIPYHKPFYIAHKSQSVEITKIYAKHSEPILGGFHPHFQLKCNEASLFSTRYSKKQEVSLLESNYFKSQWVEKSRQVTKWTSQSYSVAFLMIN